MHLLEKDHLLQLIDCNCLWNPDWITSGFFSVIFFLNDFFNHIFDDVGVAA